MNMFSIFLISAKSNDITNIFVKSIFVQKIAYTVLLCPLYIFEIKNKDLRPLNLLKFRQLSTVPLNFDCSRDWQ